MEQLPAAKIRLKPKPENFARLYATTGNGVQSYAKAYGLDLTNSQEYMIAASGANRNLKKDKICQRINELLDDSGFNDTGVDNQLNLLIRQHDDKKVKLQAIAEYNKLKKRTGQAKSVFSGNTFNLTQLLDKADSLIEEGAGA